jgi:hypothetical protein
VAKGGAVKTGYEVTLKDFLQLLSYPPYREKVAPLIRDWSGYEVLAVDSGFVLRDRNGVEVNPESVHETIQADAVRQYHLYQVAMSLWR